MTRSKPIARKKPLKRKSRLKPVSEKKRDWNRLYATKRHQTLKVEMECADCRTPFFMTEMQPHHPAGRQNANILRFVWLCKWCHSLIHDEGKWARRTGRLLPEFDSRKSTSHTPNFFKV